MKNNKGFTLLELLITVFIVGVLVTLAVIGLPAVLKNTKNSAQPVRLSKYVNAQATFRTSLGKRRYGTLSELKNAGLLDDSIVRYSGSDQVAIENYKIVPGDESTAFLQNNFKVTLQKQNRDSSDTELDYCVNADGVVRKASTSNPSQCSDSSSPID